MSSESPDKIAKANQKGKHAKSRSSSAKKSKAPKTTCNCRSKRKCSCTRKMSGPSSLANDAQPTNVTSTSESVSANTSPQLGIRPKPLVSSRSLLRIGLLKSRNAAVDTVPGTNVENQTALLKARRKMTKRASSLSDFFHSSTGTPNRPLPASSLAAAASKLSIINF